MKLDVNCFVWYITNDMSLESELRKLFRRIGQVQSRQGSEGCYMELLNHARSSGNLIAAHSYMYEQPDQHVRSIRFSLRRLPQNQTDRVVQNRSRRIHASLKPTRHG